jgi:hypothetical protein
MTIDLQISTIMTKVEEIVADCDNGGCVGTVDKEKSREESEPITISNGPRKGRVHTNRVGDIFTLGTLSAVWGYTMTAAAAVNTASSLYDLYNNYTTNLLTINIGNNTPYNFRLSQTNGSTIVGGVPAISPGSVVTYAVTGAVLSSLTCKLFFNMIGSIDGTGLTLGTIFGSNGFITNEVDFNSSSISTPGNIFYVGNTNPYQWYDQVLNNKIVVVGITNTLTSNNNCNVSYNLQAVYDTTFDNCTLTNNSGVSMTALVDSVSYVVANGTTLLNVTGRLIYITFAGKGNFYPGSKGTYQNYENIQVYAVSTGGFASATLSASGYDVLPLIYSSR